MLQPNPLRHDLVHGQARRHGPTAGIGKPQQFQRALDGAVFSVTTMQRDEDPVEARIGKVHHGVAASVEQMRIDAGAAQGVMHAPARHQRHFTFRRPSAEKHTYAAKIRTHSKSPNWAGTLLMEPAPMITTTSPSRTKSRIACGSSATSSTKTGSTRPATRRALASARPSAATRGCSPAE